MWFHLTKIKIPYNIETNALSHPTRLKRALCVASQAGDAESSFQSGTSHRRSVFGFQMFEIQ